VGGRKGRWQGGGGGGGGPPPQLGIALVERLSADKCSIHNRKFEEVAAS
jgi:hypothetical protein